MRFWCGFCSFDITDTLLTSQSNNTIYEKYYYQRNNENIRK